jgi:tetratricopeptide (TPR) repeat protein
MTHTANLRPTHASAQPSATGPAGTAAQVVALVVLATVATLAGATHIWDSDVPMHIACGDWMIRHSQVLDFDAFGIPEGPGGQEDPTLAPAPWVNVHWLFQAMTAGAYRAGGFEALSLLKALLTVAMVLALAWPLRRTVSPWWLVVCGVAMLLVAYPRIRMRPELVTLVLLTVTIALLEHVRRGGRPHVLWWLAPLVVLWVNMHGVYVVGLAVAWLAVAGEGLERLLKRPGRTVFLQTSALAPLVGASVASLLSPWPVEGATHFLVLLTRVSGQQAYYTHGVTELAPTFAVLGAYWYVIALVAAAAVLWVLCRRSAPLSHLLWLAAMVAVALSARRNVALLAPAVGCMLAAHGGELWRRVAAVARRAPALAKLTGALAAGVSLTLAGACAWALASGWAPRALGAPTELGLGVRNGAFAQGAGDYLRALPSPGDVLCVNFGDSGAIVLRGMSGLDRPRRLVFMDGRLEAHSLGRFIRNHRLTLALSNPVLASEASIPPSVRFIVVGAADGAALRALTHNSHKFKLLFVDADAAVFAHLASVDGPDLAQLPDNLPALDVPLAQLAAAHWPRRTTWRQNPPISPDRRLGRALMDLGGAQDEMRLRVPRTNTQQLCSLLAVRYLLAERNREQTVETRNDLAAASRQRSLCMPLALLDELPIDVMMARSLYLYRQLDFAALAEPTSPHRVTAQQLVQTQMQAGQCDLAAATLSRVMGSLSPQEQVLPPGALAELGAALSVRLDDLRAQADRQGVRKLPPVERARALLAVGKPDQPAQPAPWGLADEAAGVLRAAGPQATLMLADLLLNMGQPDEALAVLKQHQADLPQADVRLRRMLAQWVMHGPSAVGGAGEPASVVEAYYQALAMEELGDYPSALKALTGAATREGPLEVLKAVQQLRQRLAPFGGGL